MELFDTTTFLSRNLPTPASARNCIGQVAQDYVARALKVQIQPIDGRKEVCPDFDGGEIKSVGRNGRGLIYKWRLEKDLKHHDEDTFIYCFLRHCCPITIHNASEVADHFMSCNPSLLIVSLRDIKETLEPIPVRKFSLFQDKDGAVDKRVGYNRSGYSDGGWQFNLNIFPPTHIKRKFMVWQDVKKSVLVHATDGGAGACQRFIGTMNPSP